MMTPLRILIVLFCTLTYFHLSVSAPSRNSCVNQCGPLKDPCPDKQRCVYSSCRYECRKVPGDDPRCPDPSSLGFCTDLCSHNGNKGCKEGSICCFNGCGNYCYDPEQEPNAT